MDASNIMYENKEQIVLHASLPQISDICCAICEIDFIEVRDSSAKSNFHWQTMKCRLLIHLMPDIIASPVSGTERFIFVIAPKKCFEFGKIERILKNFKLVYQGLRPITTELYKSCFIYTIQTKIAPSWNKVGDYFVQGKEFYNVLERIRALKLNILIEEGNIYLQFHAIKMKIPHVKLEDYLLPSDISHFLADPKGHIDLARHNLPLVHVLPSTKKGKLLSVSKKLPEKCIFKDYNQMRRHWKNMYGYSLPKNEDNILYYEIKFLGSRSKIFTYPNLCIINSPLDIISSKERNCTITCFLSDMVRKLPTVCGKQLQISKCTSQNKTSLNPTLSPNILPKSKELCTQLEEKDNTSRQIEFSTRSADEVIKDMNNTEFLKAQLTRIHQIHSTPVDKDIRLLSDSKNENETQNGIQSLNVMRNLLPQNTKSICNKDNELKSSDGNFTVSKEETESRYFKTQKLMSEKIQRHVTLKEKLLKAKSSDNSCSQEMDTIEAMTKGNSSDHMNNNVLSYQLKKHSVLDIFKEKKALSHAKNTQMLHQFRM